MAQIVNLISSSRSYSYSYSYSYSCSYSPPCRSQFGAHDCISLQPPQLKTANDASFLCLFSHNNNKNKNNIDKRQEEARKALEGALSGKKNEYDKWDKQIKRREELGGGGGGGGGWFGWGGRFGWSNGDDFWGEAKQACLTILGIILMYLLVAKGDLLLAVIVNPLLYALRGVRNGFGFITSKALKSTTNNHPNFGGFLKKEDYQRASAKENVIRKWGSD